MKKKALIAAAIAAPVLLMAAGVIGYQDWQLRGSAPGNPASGFFRVWADSAGQYFKCLTSSGVACYFDPKATNSTPGIVQPDGSTISISGGVISSTVSGGMSNPMTTAGDLIIGGVSGAPGRLGAGTNGYVLTSNGTSTAPSWQASSGGSSTDLFAAGKPAGTIGNETHKNLSITAGSTATILSTVSGSGYISEVFVATNQYNTQITVTVDGEATPSIQGNLADFFGDDYQDTQPAFFGRWIQGSNSGSNNVGGTFKLPIPFASSVNITLKNNAGSTAVITSHVIYHTGVSNTWPYTQHLYMAVARVSGIAAYAETNMVNVTPGKPGRLAGFGWIYDGFPGGVSPATAPLEGPFKMYLDGASSANYATAGSEDIFGMPWYFANTTSFGATSSGNTLAPSSADVVRTVSTANTWGAQRFFIADPIVFNTGLRMSWTAGNSSAVTFTGTASMFTTVWYYTQN